MRFIILILCIYVCGALFERVEPRCNCVDRESLGRSTWKLLHDIVDNVDYERNDAFVSLMGSLSEIYPCEVCRAHIVDYLRSTPADMTHEWLCDFHNDVNRRLDKKIIHC
jgi:hypothetical protein|tara:strand:+ start:1055 stop:1384 length:330 start_codon:yes stop_codon:yes gene_type:complete